MSVKANLIAAKALIDTPEKYADVGLLSALLSNGISIREFNEMRDALLGQADHSTDRIMTWKEGKSHGDVMALFDRAIAAADDGP